MSDSKKCTRCKIEKVLTDFQSDKSKKFGVCSRCKVCVKDSRDLNKTEIREKAKKYALDNPDKILASRVKYNENNRDKERIRVKKYRDSNKEKVNKANKLYNSTKRVVDKEKQENKRLDLKNKRIAEKVLFLLKNKDKIEKDKAEKERKRKDAENAKTKEKRATDPLFRLKDNLRARTRKAFRNKYNKKSTNSELLGISYESLYKHIESLFTDGMSWDLLGKHIHIDHIIPLASADTEDELIKLCHYTNLQPLWAKDNLLKGDSMPNCFL